MDSLKITATDSYIILGIIVLSEAIKSALGKRCPRRLIPCIPVTIAFLMGMALVFMTEGYISFSAFLARVVAWATIAMGTYSVTKTTVLGKVRRDDTKA